MTVLRAFIKTLTRAIPPVLLAVAGLASPATAGDTAEVQVLGFSEDGAYFAFEQYGIQDGSGFPYSEIFVLNVAQDSWVKPSPFRRRDQIDDGDGYNPGALLSKTRAENRSAAQSLLQSTAIAGKGLTAGHNPRTELSSNPHRMVVAPRDFFNAKADAVELSLSEYPLPSGECASYGAKTKGFRLTMTYQGKARVLNEDASLPESRRCPLGYRIERIVTHFPANAPPVYAVLVQMDSHGFEGPDRRFLAITGKL